MQRKRKNRLPHPTILRRTQLCLLSSHHQQNPYQQNWDHHKIWRVMIYLHVVQFNWYFCNPIITHHHRRHLTLPIVWKRLSVWRIVLHFDVHWILFSDYFNECQGWWKYLNFVWKCYSLSSKLLQMALGLLSVICSKNLIMDFDTRVNEYFCLAILTGEAHYCFHW